MKIYEILQINNIENYLKYLENFESNKNKILKKINYFILDKKIDKKHPFFYALEHFKKKLFKEEDKAKSLFDMKIEFQPGIFISARIKGNNLILKNITYVKTENLERLNEALTGNKKITLNEDNQNSFTPENNKEISFSKDFRVVGTCNEGEEASLSDAFLSRFTVIYVDKYNDEEEKKVLKDEAGDIKDINYLNSLLEKYYSYFNDINKWNLSQKINCFNITKQVDENRQKPHQENLNLVAYYLLKGLNEKRGKNINKINSIFGIKNNEDKDEFSPIEVKNNYIISKLNQLKMNIKHYKIEKKIIEKNNNDENKIKISNLVFTQKIKELIDVIHFGLSTKTPLILEGEYGQGKMTSIKYYATIANLEIIQVSISKSTKVDDLLCKITFKKNEKGNFSLVNSKTPLCQAIECKDNFTNKLIVLEGINNASPAILEILNSIYGPTGTKILLPNGSTIEKGNMNLISIFNPSEDYTREKLPGNLINNSLYFIVENPSISDIKIIITNLFNEAGLKKMEQDEFIEKFITAQKIAKEGVGEFPITLHEVRKYISFRKSLPNLDKNIFMSFIFNYHFSQKENIYRAQKELKLDTFLFNPVIDYSGEYKYLNFKSSKRSKNQIEIEIKNSEKIKEKYEELKNKFNSMTLTEKLCFLFLLCCIKAQKTPIIQGVTASGKSFIVKLFSDILGQDLSIYQLNSNSGLSIFTGQSVIKENFDEKEKNEIKNIMKLLKIKNKNYKEISSEDFKNFQRIIDNKLNSKNLDKNEKKKYEKAKKILSILKSPLSRFTHEDSELIKSIKKGKWIALDGIEMASQQISEKLSSLCGEIPTLNIYESGLDDLNFNFTNINPNFRLFIIYNPSSQNSKKIDQSLFNKCIKFTLPSIDYSPRDATTMLYESLIRKSKSKYDIPLWSNLCSRIAKYHIEEKKITKKNPELIAGNVPFSPRHLNFISNDFHHTFRHKKISIEVWLQSIFDNYYWRSFIKYLPSKKIDYMEATKKIIKALPDQQFKVDQELDFNEEFKEIVAYLIQIQKYCISEDDKDNKEFSNILFDDLLNKCLEVPINRVKLRSLYNNLCDTILLLDNMQINDDILKNKYYQIHFIKNNYENILNNFESINEFIEQITLKDDKLLNNSEIKMYLLRMRFLNEILKNKENKSIYEPDLNYNLFNRYSNDLSQKLLDLMMYKNKSSFEDLVIFICENPDVFKIIHYYYPYNNNSLKRGQLKLADYYIYIWSHLYLKKYNFSIRIKENRYDIVFTNENQRDKITPYFVLNEKDSLLLSLKYSYVKKNLKGNKYLYKYIDISEDNTKEDIEKKLCKCFSGL